MKGQQLFHCFLPGVTAAVLTTQPAWASVMKVGEVQLTSASSVLLATKSENLFTDNSLLPKGQVKGNSGLLPASYFSQGPISPVGNRGLPVIIADNYLSFEGGKILEKDENRFVSFSDLSNGNLLATSNPTLSGDISVAKLLESSNCSQTQLKSQAALLLAAHTCLPQNTHGWIAQTTVPTTSESNTPPPSPPAENVQPAPNQPVISNVSNQLDPSPNPLLYPTQVEEVKVGGNQPISLSQALELAKRNNNDLQVSVLRLEQSKSVLREAQAALFPSVDLSADVTNSRNVGTTLQFDQARTTNPLVGDPPSNTTLSGTAQIKYDIYTSGRRNGAIQEAEERIRVQELDVERQSEEIRLNVSRGIL